MSKVVTLQDTRRWDNRICGRRIPREYWAEISNAEAILERANNLWKQAEAEAEVLKKKSYEDGWEAGRKELIAQMAHHLTKTQCAMREQLELSEQRIINMALALFKRIVPTLANELVLEDLIASALKATQAERFIRLFVHTSAIDSIRSKAEQWRLLYPSINSFEIIGDDTLGELGCIVESEAGRVHAGMDEQLESLSSFARRSVQKGHNIA